MKHYGFLLTCIHPYKDRVVDRGFCPFTGECGSVKTHIPEYFTYYNHRRKKGFNQNIMKKIRFPVTSKFFPTELFQTNNKPSKHLPVQSPQ